MWGGSIRGCDRVKKADSPGTDTEGPCHPPSPRELHTSRTQSRLPAPSPAPSPTLPPRVRSFSSSPPNELDREERELISYVDYISASTTFTNAVAIAISHCAVNLEAFSVLHTVREKFREVRGWQAEHLNLNFWSAYSVHWCYWSFSFQTIANPLLTDLKGYFSYKFTSMFPESLTLWLKGGSPVVREPWGQKSTSVHGLGPFAVNSRQVFLAGALLGNHAWVPCSPGQDEAVGANIFWVRPTAAHEGGKKRLAWVTVIIGKLFW